MSDSIIQRLMNAPYGHTITRDEWGLSHVTLFDRGGKKLHTIVAPTYAEAVTRALDLADEQRAAKAQVTLCLSDCPPGHCACHDGDARTVKRTHTADAAGENHT